MAKIDSVYNYYLTTYGSSNVSRYDAHKKSQLRDVYNRMVKLNKESPLYKIFYNNIDLWCNSKAFSWAVTNLQGKYTIEREKMQLVETV